MKKLGFILMGAFLSVFMLMARPTFALTIYDGATYEELLNDGAFITSSTAFAADFAAWDIYEHLSLTDGEGIISQVTTLADIPVFDIGGTLYFNFIYDSQEVQRIAGAADPEIIINSIAISADGIDIWSSMDSITLNPNSGDYDGDDPLATDATYTATYFGAGGDLELYIPVALFYGLDLTGSSILTFYSNVSSNHNGHEEWIADHSPGMVFFDPDDPISAPVPEPGTMFLLASGLAALAGFRKRIRKR